MGEIFDRRSLDEVLFHHTDHKDRPGHLVFWMGKAVTNALFVNQIDAEMRPEKQRKEGKHEE
jgi:hypothetical protein